MEQIHYVKDFKNMIHMTILIIKKLLTTKEKGTEKIHQKTRLQFSSYKTSKVSLTFTLRRI